MAVARRIIPDKLVTYHLKMSHRAQFKPALANDASGVSITPIAPDVSFYRYLYDGVGDTFGWRDRRLMTDADLEAAISAANISIYVMYVDGVPGGYFELGHYGDHTQIEYFGLRPKFHGRGLGKHLLTAAIDKAWESGARTIGVHTCNLDSDSALPNYLKRGFAIEHVEEETMPERYYH